MREVYCNICRDMGKSTLIQADKDKDEQIKFLKAEVEKLREYNNDLDEENHRMLNHLGAAIRKNMERKDAIDEYKKSVEAYTKLWLQARERAGKLEEALREMANLLEAIGIGAYPTTWEEEHAQRDT